MNIEYIIFPLVTIFLLFFFGMLGMFIYRFLQKD